MGSKRFLVEGPGTGKTMAAEDNTLGLDMFRVDTSSVVSMGWGDGKNLREIFDAAEGGSAVILFDEADHSLDLVEMLNKHRIVLPIKKSPSCYNALKCLKVVPY